MVSHGIVTMQNQGIWEMFKCGVLMTADYNPCKQDPYLPNESINVWTSNWNSAWVLLILGFSSLKIVLESVVGIRIVILQY